MRPLTALLASLSFALTLVAAAPAAEAQTNVERARALFQEGTEHYAAGRFREAAERFEAGYRLVRSPEMAFNVARAYERMSEYEKAIRYFRTYLRTAQLEEAERADINRRIQELEQARRRQRDQVYTAPPTGDELANEARTFFQRGVAMYQRRQYEAAMQAFTAAQRFAPLPEIFYNMAVTSERLNQRRDAIDYYREYLRLSRPDSPDRGLIERRIQELREQGR